MDTVDAVSYNRHVAEVQKFFRQERNMSMKELADACKGIISKPLIGKIEKNLVEEAHKSKIGDDVLGKIAEGLGVAIEVFTGEDQEFQSYLSSMEKQLDTPEAVGLINERIISLVGTLLEQASLRFPLDKARAFLIKGDVEYLQGSYIRSEVYNRFALFEASRTDNDELIHKARYRTARSLFVLGRYSESQELLLTDIDEYEEECERMKSCLLLGMTFAKQGVFEKAIQYTNSAMSVALKPPQQEAYLGRCYQTLGGIYRDLYSIDANDSIAFEQSVKFSELACEFARKQKDFIGEIYSLKTIGELWIGKDDATAIHYLEKSLQKADKFTGFRMVDYWKIRYCLSVCKRDFALMQEAAEKLNELDLPKEEVSEAFMEVARLAAEIGENSKAFAMYEKAIQKLRGK